MYCCSQEDVKKYLFNPTSSILRNNILDQLRPNLSLYIYTLYGRKIDSCTCIWGLCQPGSCSYPATTLVNLPTQTINMLAQKDT